MFIFTRCLYRPTGSSKYGTTHIKTSNKIYVSVCDIFSHLYSTDNGRHSVQIRWPILDQRLKFLKLKSNQRFIMVIGLSGVHTSTVINSDNREAGIQFVNHKYVYRLKCFPSRIHPVHII